VKQSQRIVKNAIFGIGGSAVGGLIYLATVLKIARSVSVTEFGKYSFVLAFAMFVSNVADSGLPRMLTRAVARDREELLPVAGATFSLIWILSGAVCLLVCIVAPFLHFGTDVKIAMVGMSLATLAAFHGSGYGAILRAYEDNELVQTGFVLHKLSLFVFVYLALKLNLTLFGFVAAHLITNILLWAFYEVLVSRMYARISLRFDIALWKKLLLDALPLGGSVMLRQLALQMDVLVLTWLSNLTVVGLFSGPYRISTALRIVPQALSTPLFPLFSRTAHSSKERFTEVYQLSVKFFLIVSIPIAVFFVSWSGPILRTALGRKYLPAIPAMQLLGIGLVPFFLSTLFQYLFAALGEQKRFFVSTCTTSILRLVLLVTLIPTLGLIGPPIAFLCSEILVVGIWVLQLHRLGFSSRFLHISWRPLVSGAIMCVLLFTCSETTPPTQRGAIAIVAMLLYGGLLFVLRAFTPEEISHVREGISFIAPFVQTWSKRLTRARKID
jgi:O-antigen/teichoic acid export membrane protein